MPSKQEDDSQSLFEKLLQKLEKSPRKKKKNEPITVLVPKLVLNPLERLIMHDTQSGNITKTILDLEEKYILK